MILRRHLSIVLAICLVLGSVSMGFNVSVNAEEGFDQINSKTKSTYYTAEKVSAARANIEKYEWAERIKDSAVAKAEQYVQLEDDFLWEIITSQSIPRSLGVLTRDKVAELGSPGPEGDEINKYGNYPWVIDPINHPWKIKSPVTGELYPSNDFESYYKSGLNEHGEFDPELADDQYLVNELYPERGEGWGVDDGYGWMDEDGNIWTFVAYYNHWALWYQSGFIMQALDALRDAYLYTGDIRYAHKGLILLDRIADVYPDMDVTEHTWDEGFDNGPPDVHTAQGKVVNDIWETGLVKTFLFAYDAFFPAMTEDPNLVPFLSDKADQYNLDNPKDSVKKIRQNIEDRIVRQVYPGMKNSQIRGNHGMHQSALALAAVVLDEPGTSKEWLDYVFESGELEEIPDPDAPYGRRFIVTGGNLSNLLVDVIDRDGFPDEASPGYNSGWINNFMIVADVLDGYERYPEYDLFNNPKFKQMLSAHYGLIIGEYLPTIGDSGDTGSPGITPSVFNHNVVAFERYGDPIFAQMAYWRNGDSVDGLHGDIFSTDPEAVADGIEEIINKYGPLELASTNLTGYGFTALRDGQNVTQSVGLTYNFPNLDIVDDSVGHKIFTDSGTLQLEADQAGAHISFSFNVPETDTYEIDLKPFKAPSYGIYTVKLDGEKMADFDFYGGSGASDFEVLSTVELTEGSHTISFENIGKHEQSSNYKLGVIQLALLDEAAQKERDQNQIGDTQRDLWMYYGRNTGGAGHGHKDTLNIGLHGYGVDLAPDLGYPEFTGDHPKLNQWTNNTISHNTVVVDESKQRSQWVGIPHHYDGDGNVQLIDVAAPKVYPQTERYRRTTTYIKVDKANSYAVDFFRVKGGSDHHFSFHGAEGDVTTEGLNLVEQPTGTYAGPDVAFGEKEPDQPSGTRYTGSGFHYLRNVERDDHPSGLFSIDWDIADTWDVLSDDDDPRLRLTMLSGVDDVALADGEPPQNKPGNPESLRYLIAHRNGEDLNSQFVSVIEPYNGDRYIESISPVELKVDGEVIESKEAAAVKVELKNGRVDYIVNALDPDIGYTVDDKFTFEGFFGVYSEKNGELVYGYLNDGTVLGDVVQTETNDLTGTVTDFTKDLCVENHMTVNLDQPYNNLDELIGSHIYVENDGERNAVYRIEGIKEQDGNQVTFDIGDSTFVRSYANPEDFSEGFIYNIAEGATFTIPLAAEGITVAAIQQRIAQFEEASEFENDQVVRALKTHLTAVSLFEQQEAADKIAKHMNGFNQLLDYQKEQELISEKAYNALKADIDTLINRWQ